MNSVRAHIHSGELYFDLPENVDIESSFHLEIFDVKGNLVVEKEMPTKHSLNVQPYPPGMYFYYLSDGMHFWKGKLVL